MSRKNFNFSIHNRPYHYDKKRQDTYPASFLFDRMLIFVQQAGKENVVVARGRKEGSKTKREGYKIGFNNNYND